MSASAWAWGNMNWNLLENSNSALQQEVLDALPALIFVEREGMIIFANAEARRMLGVHAEGWTPRPAEDVLWGLFPGTAEPQTPLICGKGSPFHATLPAAGGRLQPVEGTYCILDAVQRDAVIVAHASNRDRAPRSRLMEDVLASLPEAVAIVHDEHVLYTNPAFTQLFGFTGEEVSGGNLKDFIVPETRQFENAALEEAVNAHGHASLETVRLTRDGDFVDVAMQAAPLVVDHARAGYVLSFRNIGERKEIEARLQHDVMHDVLTGLPNRGLFLDRLNLAMSRRMRRPDQGCGVLFFDVDRFKQINDELGHAAGDELLRTVARRLNASLRPQDTAARLGGDEFGVLVESIGGVSDLEIVAARIMQEMQRPFDIFGRSMQLGVSAGAAMAGGKSVAPEGLLREADVAMYRAKQQGGNRFELFDKSLETHLTVARERERELRRVLENREFEIWYEPLYRLTTGRVEGYEALLRRQGAGGPAEGFDDLLALAEETGFSISLGRETLQAVCRQLRAWAVSVTDTELTLGVNLTARQFYHPDMVSLLKQTLDATSADPSRLVLEISETALSEDPDTAVAILQRMVDLNVRVALDHFGMDLAPLNHLMRLPIDVVKMDAQLTAGVVAAGRRSALVQALVQLGQTLGVRVMAQGIETGEQLEALRRLGCEIGQGRYLSAPQPPPQAFGRAVL